MAGATDHRPKLRHCAIYTRKSSEEGLKQSFNSLQAQREACEAYIQSQRHEGWRLKATHYDDGGFSGGTMERPALTRLIDDIKHDLVQVIVVYKVDRLSRSLADFVRLIELCDRHSVSFVSVTQQFNTSTSMGRLTLNVLLSFAQFEREVTGERIRDKIAASKQKGLWMGGVPPLGYDVQDKQLVINQNGANLVRHIHVRYLALGCVRMLKAELDTKGVTSKVRQTKTGPTGGKPFSRGALYTILKNPLYLGKVVHKGVLYEGKHPAILEAATWECTQDKLKDNRLKRMTRQQAKYPALLAGRLFDDQGNPMSPTHTQKGHRRYRYYVSQALLKYQEGREASVIRVAAKLIEQTVIEDLKRLLRSGGELLNQVVNRELTATHQKRLVSRGRQLAKEWDHQAIHVQIERLQGMIQKIILSQTRIDIHYQRTALTAALLPSGPINGTGDEDATHSYLVSLPVQLKRCGIETKLIVPGKSPPAAHTRTTRALQEALRKALIWNQALIDGDIASMAELANKEEVTQRYIAHLIKLAWLAPDIMEGIMKGVIPTTLSLGMLKKGIPLDWEEQRLLYDYDTTVSV